MKEIKLIIRIDEETGKIGHVMKTSGFPKGEPVAKLAIVCTMLDNLHHLFLSKIQSTERDIS